MTIDILKEEPQIYPYLTSSKLFLQLKNGITGAAPSSPFLHESLVLSEIHGDRLCPKAQKIFSSLSFVWFWDFFVPLLLIRNKSPVTFRFFLTQSSPLGWCHIAAGRVWFVVIFSEWVGLCGFFCVLIFFFFLVFGCFIFFLVVFVLMVCVCVSVRVFVGSRIVRGGQVAGKPGGQNKNTLMRRSW